MESICLHLCCTVTIRVTSLGGTSLTNMTKAKQPSPDNARPIKKRLSLSPDNIISIPNLHPSLDHPVAPKTVRSSPASAFSLHLIPPSSALYAHKIHSGFYHDVNNPESFGFARNQVLPFNLSTPDGETLYGWHILPLDVYSAHQSSLLSSSSNNDAKTLQQAGLNILRNDPAAKVVINFHGNAGHVAQGWRTDTYRSLAAQPHTHVFTVDYRGFGRSTGQPTEAGIITDGTALADYVLLDVGIHPARVVVLGQSLGTAVATAVGLHFATFASSSSSALGEIRQQLLPSAVGLQQQMQKEAVVFAGIVLVAPFTSLPSLLLSYRIGGLVPILAPLRPYPAIVSWVEGYILDKWHTALRLAAYVRALEGVGGTKVGKERGGVRIIHATNDMDISVEQGRLLFQHVAGSETVFDGVGEVDWKQGGMPGVKLEIVEHGGKFLSFRSLSLPVCVYTVGK